jgi:hypothetical protein
LSGAALRLSWNGSKLSRSAKSVQKFEWRSFVIVPCPTHAQGRLTWPDSERRCWLELARQEIVRAGRVVQKYAVKGAVRDCACPMQKSRRARLALAVGILSGAALRLSWKVAVLGRAKSASRILQGTSGLCLSTQNSRRADSQWISPELALLAF